MEWPLFSPFGLVPPVVHSFHARSVLGMRSTSSPVSTTWPSANRGYFIAFINPVPIQVNGFAWANGAAVAGNVDVGIYTPDGVRLVSTGAIAQSGTSTLQQSTLGTPYVLGAGWFFLGVSLSSASGRLYAITPSASTGQGCMPVFQVDSVHPLPATIAAFSTVAGIGPVCGFVTYGNSLT